MLLWKVLLLAAGCRTLSRQRVRVSTLPLQPRSNHIKKPVVILSEAKDLSSKPRHKLSLQAAIREPQLAGNAPWSRLQPRNRPSRTGFSPEAPTKSSPTSPNPSARQKTSQSPAEKPPHPPPSQTTSSTNKTSNHPETQKSPPPTFPPPHSRSKYTPSTAHPTPHAPNKPAPPPTTQSQTAPPSYSGQALESAEK